MPYIEGTVSSAFNKLITVVELIGAGDGIETVFPFTVTKPFAFLDSLNGSYTIGASGFTFTSDTSGVITGTNISSGSFDGKDGTITFSTAPDDLTNVDLDDYITKGLLQTLKEYITSENENTTHIFTEVVGTGDGIQTVFPIALSNFPTAPGQVRIEFRIAGSTTFIYEDGAGNFTHPLISASSYNATTGVGSITLTAPQDDTFEVKAFYTDATIEGRDWLVLLDQNTKDNNDVDAFSGLLLQEFVVKNSGISFKESVQDGGICLGFREFQNTGADIFNIQFNLYDVWGEAEESTASWVPNLAKNGFSYNATNENWRFGPHTPVDDNPLSYFISVTKSRIVFAIKVSGTVYTGPYLGAILRGSSPSSYKKPYFIIANFNDALSFTSTTALYNFLLKPAISAAGFNQGFAFFIRPDGSYENDCFFRASPVADSFINTGTLKSTSNGKVITHPCVITDSVNFDDFGELDGVEWAPNNVLTSEDTLTDQNATDWIVFQNIFRTAYQEFYAINKDL